MEHSKRKAAFHFTAHGNKIDAISRELSKIKLKPNVSVVAVSIGVDPSWGDTHTRYVIELTYEGDAEAQRGKN